MLHHHNLTVRKLVKFVCTNGIGAIICFSITYVLTEQLHIWYMLSMFLGLIPGTTWNFVVNAIWTFGDERERRTSR